MCVASSVRVRTITHRLLSRTELGERQLSERGEHTGVLRVWLTLVDDF